LWVFVFCPIPPPSSPSQDGNGCRWVCS
jgi:hypothetical protein